MRTPFNIVKSGLVRGDHSRSGTRLNRHITDGHPPFHGEVFNRLSAILDHVALPASGADLGDDRQNDVFRIDSGTQFPWNVYRHSLKGFKWQCLGG